MVGPGRSDAGPDGPRQSRSPTGVRDTEGPMRSRRAFLKVALGGTSTLLVAACGTAAPAAPTTAPAASTAAPKPTTAPAPAPTTGPAATTAPAPAAGAKDTFTLIDVGIIDFLDPHRALRAEARSAILAVNESLVGR